jgi:hypothetical protein
MPTYSIDTENSLAVHPDKDAWRAVKPMLAGMYAPNAVKLPVDVQPKLDGLRCMVCADDLVLRSRGGKAYKHPDLN